MSPLDEKEIYEIANNIKGQVDSVAITSVFSPVSKKHENRAAEIIKEVLGEHVPISLSSEIGSVGLLERENATILNAAVVNVQKATAEGFINALKKEGVDAKVFFGQNDGTLMSVEYAIKYPILTVASGPTNSLRGASYLSGYSDALVVDVGGTTTDIGVLINSFPRESSLAVELGGDTLTTTDVVVALGKSDLGDSSKTNHLDRDLLEKIYQKMVEMVEVAIDKMKTSANPVPVVLVGGGSILLPEKLKGASTVLLPENFGVANSKCYRCCNFSG